MGMADSYKIELSRLRSGGATNGQVLTYSTTTGTWYPATGGGGGTPAGSDTYIQYNNAGAFGGSADLTWASPDFAVGADSGTGNVTAWGDITIAANGGKFRFQDSGFIGQFRAPSGGLTGSWDWRMPDQGGILLCDGYAAAVTFLNDVIIDDSAKGLVLTSPDASTARITINNSDVLQGVTAPPAGSDTFVQFNQVGAFGATPDLTWDGTNLTVGADSGVGNMTTYGDVEVKGSTSNGFILQSPDNTRWRITVNNSGVLVVTAV